MIKQLKQYCTANKGKGKTFMSSLTVEKHDYFPEDEIVKYPYRNYITFIIGRVKEKQDVIMDKTKVLPIFSKTKKERNKLFISLKKEIQEFIKENNILQNDIGDTIQYTKN